VNLERDVCFNFVCNCYLELFPFREEFSQALSLSYLNVHVKLLVIFVQF
jgi:hypothetical protein